MEDADDRAPQRPPDDSRGCSMYAGCGHGVDAGLVEVAQRVDATRVLISKE